MFPMENGDDAALDDASSVAVAVNFSGAFGGKIVVRVESGVLPVIAANMLGEEEPVADELMADALGEIANVICGNALPAIAGKKEVFRLQPPAPFDGGAESKAPAAKAALALDEGLAEVFIYLDEGGNHDTSAGR